MTNNPEIEEQITQITEALKELNEDGTVPKNVKVKLQKIIDRLNEGKEPSIKIHEALSDLDDIADDTNLQPFTRTQIWNIVSVLEKIQ